MDYATLKERIVRVLGDNVTGGSVVSGPSTPVAGTLYTAELLADGVNAALIALTTRQWKNSFVDVAGDATTYTADVPDGLLEIEGIYDEYYKQFVPRVNFLVNGTQFNTWVNSWYISPTGTIRFLNAIKAGVRIFYSTYWTVPSDDDDDLETPNFCDNALVYYAASHCALSKASQSASIRQFNTKVDSGTPEQNPLEQMSIQFIKRFEREMSIMPMMFHNNVEARTGASR
jgi:hypothetical protein